jgi:glycosidase
MMRKRTRLLPLLLMTVALCFGGPLGTPLPARAAPSPLSPSDVVYMLLTDRFSDGDPTNNNLGHGEYVPGNLKMYQGGDWQGVINQMPYLKALGVTAIWISPVSNNEWFSRDGTEAGYHGYFTHDFNSPNPHFGTTALLTQLVTTAHANGIKVILDVVPNHTADYLAPNATTYDSPTYQPAPPYNNTSWYHPWCDITDWNNQWQVENCELGGLDDLAQENPAVDSALKSTYTNWFTTTGADAARVDAARSIPKTWLQSFQSAIGVQTFGEIFQGDPSYVSDYQNYEWSVLDFPLFFNARDTFAYDHSFNQIKGILDQDWRYPHPERLITFMDNHDRDRFLALADDNYRRLRLAMTFLYTVRGIPDVYYGTEQALYGGGRPTEWQGIANNFNREVMPSFSQNGVMFQWMNHLAQIRGQYPALQTGTQREMWIEDSVYAYSRRIDATAQEAIVAMTNSWDPQTRTIPLRAESTIAVGTVLTNLLNTSDTVTVAAGGVTGKQITVALGTKEAKVLVTGTPTSWSPPATTMTTIKVHYNAGYGNALWLRGDTYPFWWDLGRSMRNTGNNVWTWETERLTAGQTVQVKPLINDYTYSDGSNFTITGGTTVDLYPTFHPSGTTRIRVHRDVGAGNNIKLRGDTAPLNWTSGAAATWSNLNAWTWETTAIPVGQRFEFKPLINDTTYSVGNNYVGIGGQTMDVYPIYNVGETERSTSTVRAVYSGASSMSIAGSVAPFSWTMLQAMTFTEGNVWVWETTGFSTTTAFDFKPLRNGTDWSLGGNYSSRGGETIEVYPSF